MAKSKSKGHDYTTVLLWSAAIVSVVRYAAAFIASDVGEITGRLSETITVAIGISGLGMGILDVVGGAYLFDGWRRAMPRKGQAWSMRFKVLTVFVLGLPITGVFILTPFTMSRVLHVPLDAVLGDGWLLALWALLVNIAPAMLVGGASLGHNMVTVNAQNGGQMSSSNGRANGRSRGANVRQSGQKAHNSGAGGQSEGQNAPQMGGQMSAQMGEMGQMGGQIGGQMSVQVSALDELAAAHTVRDWRALRRRLSREQVRLIAAGRTADIQAAFGISAKQARRWRQYAAQELEAVSHGG